MTVSSADPVEQFLIEVHNLRTADGKICNYHIGLDLQDEIRIARILVSKIAAMEREACAKTVEQAGIDGYGTLAAAALIRVRNQP